MDILSDHLAHPRNVGRISPGPSGRSIVVSEVSGDALRLSIRVEGGRIIESRFRSFGNPVLGACASFVTEGITGQEIEMAADIRVQDVANVLRIPSQQLYCVTLVILALLEAIQDFRRRFSVVGGGRAS